MNRRQYLVGAGTALSVVVAGCTSGDDQETHAESVVDAIDDGGDLEVLEWNLQDDGTFYLEYSTNGNPGFDIQVIGGSYAGGVDNGLEGDLMGVAVDVDDDETAYWVDIEPEWAQDFMDDEITEDEYMDLIADTIE